MHVCGCVCVHVTHTHTHTVGLQVLAEHVEEDEEACNKQDVPSVTHQKNSGMISR